MSAVLHPLPLMPPLEVLTLAPPATQPLVWGDWGRRRPRREWMRLVREQRVDILMEPPPADKAVVHQLWTRAQRAHWRLSWSMRLAHNARSPAAVCVAITVFGLPSAFAAFLALPVV